MSASVPIFCLCFQIRTNQKAKHVLQVHHVRCTASVLPTSASSCQQVPIRAYLNPSIFGIIKLSLFPCLHLSFYQIQVMAADSLALASSEWIEPLLFFIWMELFISTAPQGTHSLVGRDSIKHIIIIH